MAKALTLHVAGGPEVGRKIEALPEGVIIGRSRQADVVLQGQRVSRQHVCIYQRRGRDWIIEDLGSHNGTFVNGEAVAKGLLYPGDRIELGAVTLRVAGGFPRKTALAAAVGVLAAGGVALAVFLSHTPRATAASAPAQVRPVEPARDGGYITHQEALRQEAGR